MRKSRQRQIIFELLKATTSHPTAEALWVEARRVMPGISLGTVYRNLNLLARSGQVQQLDLPTDHARFDGNALEHCHFQCLNCGRVFDLDCPHDNDLNLRLSQQSGHDIARHTLNFYGLCRECKAKGGSHDGADQRGETGDREGDRGGGGSGYELPRRDQRGGAVPRYGQAGPARGLS